MFAAELPGIVVVLALIAGLLVLVLAAMEFGWRRGNRRVLLDPEGAEKGTTALDSAVFALFGLLLAFTFSGGATRFGERRELINAEANAIGTAYLRVSLLPAASQSELRSLYREYVEVRLNAPAVAVSGDVDRTPELQNRIWQRTIAALEQHQGQPIVDSVLDPVNEMIDITATRWLAARTHPPPVIYMLLIGLSVICGFLGGYNMGVARRRHVWHAAAFALTISLVLYVTFDIEFPRVGLVRLDFADATMVNLLNSMPPEPP